MFRVGVTRDLRGADGRGVFDLGVGALEAEPGIEWAFLAVHEPELTPETVAVYDAVMIWEPGAVTERSLAGSRRLRLIARLGMGLDALDIDACTASGVIITTATDAVRDSVPTGAIALLLSLAHKLPEKDRITREGRGWEDRFGYVGLGTNGRTLGIIGLGNVGGGVARRAQPLGLHCLAYDPYADPSSVPDGVELVELETLLRAADYVCVTCPLSDETRHLIDAARLAQMRPGSYLINVARGPIVDTLALADALTSGHLAGAALDVFETEPPELDHPVLAAPNLIVAPHAVSYTTPSLEGMGRTATAAVLAVARGEVPARVVNPDALA